MALLLLVPSLLLGRQSSGLKVVEETWELRGKIAESKLNEMILELEVFRITQKGRDTDEHSIKRLVGHIALESAYAHHQKLPDSVRKKIEGGLECQAPRHAQPLSALVRRCLLRRFPGQWAIRRGSKIR